MYSYPGLIDGNFLLRHNCKNIIRWTRCNWRIESGHGSHCVVSGWWLFGGWSFFKSRRNGNIHVLGRRDGWGIFKLDAFGCGNSWTGWISITTSKDVEIEKLADSVPVTICWCGVDDEAEKITNYTIGITFVSSWCSISVKRFLKRGW